MDGYRSNAYGGIGGYFDDYRHQSGPATDSSWTDDIPLCKETGVGCSQNQVYRRDGHRTSDHDSEDESFHFKCDSDVYLYGVFDGHCGPQAAKFVFEKMPAEILLGQLHDSMGEDEVREVLRQAFLSVERAYFSEAIGQKLAERAMFLPEHQMQNNPVETYRDYPHILTQYKEVESGTTAVVALIFNGKLYVSNVGNCKALLCRKNKDGVLKVIQLSVDHDLNNEDELARLEKLGLNISLLKRLGKIGSQTNTRCLGNYFVKGGYKELLSLQGSKSEPVIPDPEIHPSIKIDESFQFLVLLSDGLYQSLKEASDENAQVDIQLAQMIVDELRQQSTLNLVAQAVVDRIGRKHHEFFMSCENNGNVRREDMTLLIRKFDSLKSSLSGLTAPGNGPLFNSQSYVGSAENTLESGVDRLIGPSVDCNTQETTSTESSDLLTQSNHKLPLDEKGRIAAYVNFSDYYVNLTEKGVTESNIFL